MHLQGGRLATPSLSLDAHQPAISGVSLRTFVFESRRHSEQLAVRLSIRVRTQFQGN